MLNSDPGIRVIDTAKDGVEAVDKISKIKPDVVTLDLAMPGWDGYTTLKHIMSRYPIPVVILSAHSREGADITIRCLNAGAVGFVLKPSGELSLDIGSVKVQLLEEVKAVSKVKVKKIKLLITKKVKKPRRKLIGINKIIVIGASTGGPQTLEAILSSLPAEFPIPIIVIQHIPTEFFTQSLAERLNRICELGVKVAEDNEIIRGGKAYLALSGFRLTVKTRIHTDKETNIEHQESRIKHVFTSLSKDKPNALGPSIDITMKSLAKIYNGNAVGIILTGMGCDGREGMKAIKGSGGKTIAQDESSIIFGMPKAVIDAGYANKVLSVSGIADAMVDLAESRE